MMKSLQGRLAFWLGLSLIIIFGGIALAVSQFPRYLTEEYVLTRLEHDGDSLKNRLIFTAGHAPEISAGPVAPIYEHLNSGHYYAVKNEQGVLRSKSLGDFQLEFSPLPAGEFRREYATGPAGQTLLLWSKGGGFYGEHYTLAVAEDISHMEAHLAKFQWQYLEGVVVTLLILLGVQAFVIRASLKPLDNARSQLKEMVEGQRDNISAEVPREINPLVNEVNRLGEVTRRNIEKSRNALGNLAHALKTPLAVITQTIEAPDEKPDQTFATLKTQSKKIQQTIESELKRARISGTTLPGQRFSLDEEIPPLIKVLEQVYQDRKLEIQVKMPAGVAYRLDRADMHEMFGNLLDNACKWARHRISLTVQTEKCLSFTIEDDGPGIGDDQLDAVTHRGKRLDETVPGHGLGLSIVREIVQTYDGEITFGKSTALGGLKVSVHLSGC